MSNDFITLKDGIFTVGIDDAPHIRGQQTTKLVFIFCRGKLLEYILTAEIEVDGLDATDKLIEVLISELNRFSIIFTHGITCGGFNLLDLEVIHKKIQKPVIAVTENTPQGAFYTAMKNLPDYLIRKEIADKAGKMHACAPSTGEKNVYFYKKGITVHKAQLFIEKFAFRSRLPEQVLLAHKIASGI
ncbi:MAG: DUF99 family protein [Candidatus Lokiarchaeota archaeon]|nr:DUF99 family protein [Candidatus Lokiarchaeota archaeon]